ncbi:DUF5011 domain-containing protein [Stigmatella aurantiaca]|nr:DUF5011 domain-containing protein [Stigmatella aurantiaca]
MNGWVHGVYTRAYTLSDSAGNAAQPVSRTVEVTDCPG